MGVKFGTEEGTDTRWCNVSLLRGENPQNRPLSKLNNRRFALRATLPVKKTVLPRQHRIQTDQQAAYLSQLTVENQAAQLLMV